MSSELSKPKPSINEDIAPFWAGVEEDRFLLYQCTKCGAWYWPASYCRSDHGLGEFQKDMEWRPASGRGTIFAFNVHRRAFDPSFEVPYIYALIELEEGPMFATNIIDCRPEDVRVGETVKIVFRHQGGTKLPFAQLQND